MNPRKPRKARQHPLITNYGLFWHRDNVVWGRGSNKGHLKGIRARTSTPVDFRDQKGVYCLYDDSFRLVYVGQVGGGNKQRLFDRLKHHTKSDMADRWSRFSWFGIRPVNSKSDKLRAEKKKTHPQIGDVINHIEAILIAATEPPHNGQSGRFGKNVHQYLQYKDEDNLETGDRDMLKTILNSLNKMEKNIQKPKKPQRKNKA